MRSQRSTPAASPSSAIPPTPRRWHRPIDSPPGYRGVAMYSGFDQKPSPVPPLDPAPRRIFVQSLAPVLPTDRGESPAQSVPRPIRCVGHRVMRPARAGPASGSGPGLYHRRGPDRPGHYQSVELRQCVPPNRVLRRLPLASLAGYRE